MFSVCIRNLGIRTVIVKATDHLQPSDSNGFPWKQVLLSEPAGIADLSSVKVTALKLSQSSPSKMQKRDNRAKHSWCIA